jgi:hypothetical protein
VAAEKSLLKYLLYCYSLNVGFQFKLKKLSIRF